MKHFFDWVNERGLGDVNAKVMIIGKGPSFRVPTEAERKDFIVFSLNHVVDELVVNVAHAIDMEVIEQCGDSLIHNCEYVVMPWVPHVKSFRPLNPKKALFLPGKYNLSEWLAKNKTLAKLERDGRLLYYDLASSGQVGPKPDVPKIDAADFSAAVLTRLIALSGLKHIRTVGVDGGSAYSASFKDMEGVTKLQTGQSSYDSQFRSIAETIHKYNISFGPITACVPMKIFVGGVKEQALATQVLKYSIAKNSSISTEIILLYQVMQGPHFESYIDNVSQASQIPFDSQRFLIPKLCDYSGRAIYIDSAVVALKDMAKLWLQPFGGAEIISVNHSLPTDRRTQFSVMVLNCEALLWDIDEILRGESDKELSSENLSYEMAAGGRVDLVLPTSWNSLEYCDSTTSLLNYADMSTQPWLSANNKNGHLWCQYLLAAIDDGWIGRDFVLQEIARGHVRPSLKYQIEHNVVDPHLLPIAEIKADLLGFIPPYVSRPELKRKNELNRLLQLHIKRKLISKLKYSWAKIPIRNIVNIIKRNI